jgi:hypothetical protein
MTGKEPALPPDDHTPVLNRVCIYCHEEKASYQEADACELEHERTMSHSQLQTRHAMYRAKFLQGEE